MTGKGAHLWKHGGSGTRLYNIWKHMNQRTNNPNDKNYPDYGGRGIKVCDAWRHDFPTFRDWAISNGYTDDMTIDRIENNNGYEPDNCRWVPFEKQGGNRRNCNMITAFGITDTVAGWSKRAGIPAETIRSRVNHLKWEPERAVSEGGR